MKTVHALRNLISAVNDYRGLTAEDMRNGDVAGFVINNLDEAMEAGAAVLKRDPEVCHSCFADATWHILCPACGAVQ
jgi:hypothetical protein